MNYPDSQWERIMKIQDVFVGACHNKLTWEQAATPLFTHFESEYKESLLAGRNDGHIDEPALELCDFSECGAGQVDLAVQPFGRAAVVDAADNPFPVHRINDHELGPKRIIPGRAGHFSVVELLPVRGEFLDAFVFFAVPRGNAELRFRKIQLRIAVLQIARKDPD